MYAQTEEMTQERIGWQRGTDEEPVTGAETILLVEDEAFVREVTSEVLRSAGYGILTAKDAAEAVCFYDQHCGDVDLLLTDVILPGESGRVLVGKLRRRNPRLKVLYVTGYAEQMRCEADHECLAKPFSTEVLLQRVRQLLDRGEFQCVDKCLVMPVCDNE